MLKSDEREFGLWMEFFTEATRDDSSLSRLPVLLFEPRRDKMNEFVFIPGYISFQEVSEDDDKDVDQPQIIQIWHCIKSEQQGGRRVVI